MAQAKKRLADLDVLMTRIYEGTIVGEYSVDKKYFSDLSKPRGDINHALCNRMRELPMEDVTEREYEQFRRRFYQFFKRERDTKSADYFKALHLHEEKIAALAHCGDDKEKSWRHGWLSVRVIWKVWRGWTDISYSQKYFWIARER